MPELRSPSAAVARTRHSHRPHLVWASLVVLVVGGALVAAALTEQPEGQCTGIGWGCTLSGADLAGLLAVLIVPPAIIVLIVGHLLIAFVQRRRRAGD